MRAGRILFGVVVAMAFAMTLAQVGPALAQTASSFKSGAWVGRAQFDAQQNFQYCIVYRSRPDGLEFGFRVTKELVMMIGLSNRAWNMPASTGYEFSVELGDYKKSHRGAVAADLRSTLWINVGNDADLRRAIAGGGTLNLVGKDNSKFALDIGGGDNAMRKLLACTALFGVE
jgi:hypothetical protein